MPITSLVQRNSSSQSSLGTPRTQAITAERERRGDALDEVELARRVRAERRVVEDLDRDALDVGAPLPHRTRREASRSRRGARARASAGRA